MSQILIAQFDDFDSAHAAANELRSLGMSQGDMEIFMLNAPGQHDRTAIGGDQDKDPGARKGDEGAVAGASVGGAAGLAAGAIAGAALPVVGPIAVAAGAVVGAYTGALHGAVNKMGDDEQTAHTEIPDRPAGVRLATHILSPSQREHVLAAFHRYGSRSIEEAEGTWRDATWSDFDPVSVPHWVEPPTQHLAP